MMAIIKIHIRYLILIFHFKEMNSLVLLYDVKINNIFTHSIINHTIYKNKYQKFHDENFR